MKEYAVFFVALAKDVDFDVLDRLSDELLAVDGIVGAIENRTLEVALSISAARTDLAAHEGIRVWEKALSSVGLSVETISVTAVDARFVETDGPQPAFPQIVGIGEIAALGGLSTSRASGLARSSAFPPPLADLKSGPVFSKSAVERFFDGWQRKPGRPRKGAAGKASSRRSRLPTVAST